MAGLGTGAAPFRAFLQHRAMLADQGVEVGPVYYYFGSRYQAAEYLYGEEIEAFIQQGVITRAGLAFSRDGTRKVYIQHKMLEDSKELADMLANENGVFYLCGPTWPVPDVYEALVGALTKYNGHTAESAGEYLEGLKEEERYVLEVRFLLTLSIPTLTTACTPGLLKGLWWCLSGVTCRNLRVSNNKLSVSSLVVTETPSYTSNCNAMPKMGLLLHLRVPMNPANNGHSQTNVNETNDGNNEPNGDLGTL